MMKEQGPRVQKRVSTLPHRSLARLSSSQTNVMESLVSTIKQIFHNLNCLPQDLRHSGIYGVFLNHIFPVSHSIGHMTVT